MLYKRKCLPEDFVHCKNRKPRDKSMHLNPMDTLSLTKEARIYNGEKTISLTTSGAGKIGQPLVKE